MIGLAPSSSTRLAADVEVGPFAVVGPNVVIGPAASGARGHTTIGRDCQVFSSPRAATRPRTKYKGSDGSATLRSRVLHREPRHDP
jgi:acyl-[acyl carrier protein]--UDP-N-acetylglucosamine O-acyltransferase